TGERDCGNGKAVFGNKKEGYNIDVFFSEEDKKKLELCECSVCKELPKNAEVRWENLRQDWVKRAYHNKWVMEHEERVMNELKNDRDEYEKFLDQTIGKSGLK